MIACIYLLVNTWLMLFLVNALINCLSFIYIVNKACELEYSSQAHKKLLLKANLQRKLHTVCDLKNIKPGENTCQYQKTRRRYLL